MSLKNLINLQKQKATSESPNTTASTSAPRPEAVVEAESPKAEPEPAPPANPAKPKGLGLNLVKSGAQGNAQPVTKAPVIPAKTKPPVAAGEFSLEDLATMDASSIPESEERSYDSGYADEIEATAPDRELPADISAEQMSFVESLDGIYQVLHDAEMFGQTVRMIMIELQDNPEYERLLADSDIHVMIRGMRRTMGLARVRKQEKSRKASTNKNARAKAGVSDDAMALLDTLMGGGDA